MYQKKNQQRGRHSPDPRGLRAPPGQEIDCDGNPLPPQPEPGKTIVWSENVECKRIGRSSIVEMPCNDRLQRSGQEILDDNTGDDYYAEDQSNPAESMTAEDVFKTLPCSDQRKRSGRSPSPPPKSSSSRPQSQDTTTLPASQMSAQDVYKKLTQKRPANNNRRNTNNLPAQSSALNNNNDAYYNTHTDDTYDNQTYQNSGQTTYAQDNRRDGYIDNDPSDYDL